MYQFHKHKIKKNGNETIITLYLDSQDVEFAEEFMGKGNPRKDLEKSAQQYVKSKFPNLKNATVKIMAGSMLVATLGLGAGGALAAENEGDQQTATQEEVSGADGTAETADTGAGTDTDVTDPETDTDVTNEDEVDDDATGEATEDTDEEDEAGTVTGTTPVTFPDIEEDSFYAMAATVLTEKDVIKGIDGKFMPNKSLTRAEAAALIVRSLGLDTEKKADGAVFKDVTGDWYYGAIAALKEKKVINGYPDGTFKPNEPVSRAELSKMMVKAFELKGESDLKAKYTDLNEKEWYMEFIAPLDKAGIVQGIGNKKFAPNKTTTRAEAVTMLNRTLNEKQFGKVDGMLTITAVTDATVTINGKPFVIGDQVKGLLNAENAVALENAVVYAQTDKKGEKIEKLRYIEITKSGEEGTPVVFKGGEQAVDGSVVVSGDYVELSNVTINKDLIIRGEVTSNVELNNVDVKGKTTVNGTEGVVSAATAETGIVDGGTITLHDSTLADVFINKANYTVNATGDSIIASVELGHNGKINTGIDGELGKLVVKNKAENVEVNGTVANIEVDTASATQITGTATVAQLKVVNKGDLNLQLTGNIEKLDVANGDVKLTLNETVRIKTLAVPKDKEVDTVITNYDAVKGNIEKVNEEDNPDATPAPDGVPSATTSTITTNYIGNNALQFIFTIKDASGAAISDLTAEDFTVKLRGQSYNLSSNNFQNFENLDNGQYKVIFNPGFPINETVEVIANDSTIKTDLAVNTSEQIAQETATVSDLTSLNTALSDENVKTIVLDRDILTDEKIVVKRAVKIDGGTHAITFTGDVENWQGNYVVQVYNTNDVEISNIKLSGGDAGLLVNSSSVKLTGTVDVSGNAFGGIEVSKGSAAGLGDPSLDISEATLKNDTEAYGLPTIWEDKLANKVTGTEGKVTSSSEIKANQVQYYINADNITAPANNETE